MRSLKGSCALLELLDPDDIVCQGLVSRTVEIAKRTEGKRLIVVSVAVGTGAHEATAKAFAKSARITWPLGVDRGGETFVAAGMPNLPRYLLVAPDGRVMWEGSPAALDDRTLDGFLERARLWRPEEVAKSIRPAADAFVKGKYAAAEKKAAEALEELERRKKAALPVEGTEERDAAVVRDAIRTMAEIRLGIAAKLAKDRWSLDAREILEGVAAQFAGTAWEAKAKEALAAIAGDARAQAEIAALTRLRGILGKIRPLTRHTVQKAIEGIDDLLEPYGNLVTGERARAEKERLQRLLEKL